MEFFDLQSWSMGERRMKVAAEALTVVYESSYQSKVTAFGLQPRMHFHRFLDIRTFSPLQRVVETMRKIP